MHPSIERIERELTAATEWMRPEDWLQGAPGKWSAAQIAEHLTLAFSGTSNVMRQAIAQGSPSGNKIVVWQRLAAFLIIEVGYFPPGRKAPAQVEPNADRAGSRAAAEILPALWESLRAMDASIQASEERFGASTPLCAHPILGALSAARWRKFHVVHALHHARQLAALRSLVALPVLDNQVDAG